MKSFNKHIIITGSARSGTSWLAETISKTFRYRLLFEPDHENHVPNAKELLCDKLIEPAKKHKKLDAFLIKIFSNKLDNNWIAQNSNRKYKMHLWPWLPKKFVIKLIRSNLGIKYINKKFQVPVIHIVRNPYDVIFSQNRVKFPWLYKLDYFKEQAILVQMIKEKFEFDICKTNFTEIEKLAVRWCIENIVLLEHQDEFSFQAKVIKYEELKGNIFILKELSRKFNFDLHPEIESIFNKPSSKTHPKSQIINFESPSKKLSDKEHQQVKNILQSFKVTLYDI